MKKVSRDSKTSVVHLGFQIAPMIDVVFVIMLFFMVMAGAVTVEKSHTTHLPMFPTDDPVPLLDEILIRVEDDGQVYLNDDLIDSPEARNLPELANILTHLRESSTATKSDVFVTIAANEHATYQRVVDVLDALSLARIDKVTFTTAALD